MLFRSFRRKRLRRGPFRAQWDSILRADMPLYSRLPEADRLELQGHIRVFLAEKYFEGCRGFRIDDRVRLLIAAQACLLLLHREHDYFPGLRTVLVYPGTFLGRARTTGPGGIVTLSEDPRLGESWFQPIVGGPVVLSWPEVLAGAADSNDARNVVLHEFAHQLDAESGEMEGMPWLGDLGRARRWREIMAREQRQLAHDAWAHRATVLNPYGMQSPAEFFAVATEAYFERAGPLRDHHPELHAMLKSYFVIDPAAEWFGTAASLGQGVA
ncbi:MAG: zinc-dependent peptidase [Phycisphaerales bacterium]